jgi:DNA repair ATPase RecN
MKELSKKDLAFEKERIKFRQEKKTLLKEISDKDKEIEGLKTLVRQINNKIEEQNEWIERLLEYCNLNEDDLKQLKNRCDINEQITNMNNLVGAMFSHFM